MNDTLPVLRPTGGISQQRLFQWLRWRLSSNATGVILRTGSMRLATVILCSLLVWAAMFFGSEWGFRFVHYQLLKPPDIEDFLSTVFDLFFLSLTMMLIFSGGIILYSSLFSSPETNFLLTLPARADHIFAYKYQGAIAFSSWAFILLGSPVLLAYGLVFHVAWYFYALLPLFFLGFVLLPGSIGALACLAVVNLLPRRRKQVLALAIVVVILLLIARGAHLAHTAARNQNNWNADAVRTMFRQFAFARSVVVPSHWMSRGLILAGKGQLLNADERHSGALYYLALIWSNGLFLYLLTAWCARGSYRRGYNRVATGGTLRRRYDGHWLDHLLETPLFFLDPQIRLLIVKDFRTFRRDPAQWAQILIFSGLLLLYFVNTRRFYQETIPWAYQDGVSLLNVSATAVLLCAWTGRFIYPMLSLEGQKFWILGLLPLKRERLLWGKFAFSATGALVLAELLVLLSDLFLAMPVVAIVLHVLTVAVLSVGLSGLSVGLGAWIPNFRERDPSKIAVGFGGTLNLIASLLFLILVLALMALPWHAATVWWGPDEGTVRVVPMMVGGVLAGLVLGSAAVVLPLRLGARTLRRMEF